MSVGIDTAHPLAGSLITDSPAVRRTRAPGKLVLICEECQRRIAGDSGFACVHAGLAARAASQGRTVNWAVVHAGCLPEATSLCTPYVRVWASRITTTAELLNVVTDLGRHPWLSGTNWPGLVRRIQADSAAWAERTEQETRKAAERRARHKTEGLADSDERHGTDNAYINLGCRCAPCTTAHTDAIRQARSATHSDQQSRTDT